MGRLNSLLPILQLLKFSYLMSRLMTVIANNSSRTSSSSLTCCLFDYYLCIVASLTHYYSN